MPKIQILLTALIAIIAFHLTFIVEQRTEGAVLFALVATLLASPGARSGSCSIGEGGGGTPRAGT